MRLLGTAHARVRQVDFGRGQWEQCTLLQDKAAACCKFGLLRRTHAAGLSCSSGALLPLPPPKINLVDALPKSRISHLDTLKYLLTKSYRTTLYT